MGWYLRKSLRIGPLRINLSKSGIGGSVGVTGLRVGTGPKGPYVQGGRDGIYFRESLSGAAPEAETANKAEGSDALEPVPTVKEAAPNSGFAAWQIGSLLLRAIVRGLRGR